MDLEKVISRDYRILGRKENVEGSCLFLENYTGIDLSSVVTERGKAPGNLYTEVFEGSAAEGEGTPGLRGFQRIKEGELNDFTLYQVTEKGGQASISQTHNISELCALERLNFSDTKAGGRFTSYYGFELKYLVDVALQVGKTVDGQAAVLTEYLDELQEFMLESSISSKDRESGYDELLKKAPSSFTFLKEAPLGKWLSHWGLRKGESLGDYIMRLERGDAERCYYINHSMYINPYTALRSLKVSSFLSENNSITLKLPGESEDSEKVSLGLAERSLKVFNILNLYLQSRVVDDRLELRFLFSVLDEEGKEKNKGYILRGSASMSETKGKLFDCEWGLVQPKDTLLDFNTGVIEGIKDEGIYANNTSYTDLDCLSVRTLEVDGRYLVVVDDAHEVLRGIDHAELTSVNHGYQVHRLMYLWFNGRGELEDVYSLNTLGDEGVVGGLNDLIHQSNKGVGDEPRLGARYKGAEIDQVFVNPGQLRFFQ